jgi:hypothetical protein
MENCGKAIASDILVGIPYIVRVIIILFVVARCG